MLDDSVDESYYSDERMDMNVIESNPDMLFKSLAEDVRRRALQILLDHDLSVSELTAVLDLPQSTVSRHLKILRDTGLLRDRRDGTTVIYSMAVEMNGREPTSLVESLLAWLKRQPVSEGDQTRLEALLARRRAMSEQFFDKVGRHWDNLREESFGQTFHLEALLSLLPDSWTVADLGTGTGYLLPALGRQFKHVVAVEPVDKMLEVAAHRVEVLGLTNVDLQKGDLSSLPLADELVDLAVAILVLHHTAVPNQALKEIWRVIKPGGTVLIIEQSAHDHVSFRERMQDRWWGFEVDAFTDWVRKAGFADVQAKPLANQDLGLDAPALFIVRGKKNAR